VAGGFTYLGVKKSAEANSTDLATKLTADRKASRDSLDQSRREGAYVAMLKFVHWLSNYQAVRYRLVDRRISVVLAVRLDRRTAGLAADLAAERDAFMQVVPDKNEEATLAAAPTQDERADALARFTAFASPPLVDAFEALTRDDDALSAAIDEAEHILLRGPLAAVVDAAQIETPERILAARARFDTAVSDFRTKVRQDLAAPAHAVVAG
jgi:hypothetical protein